MRKTTTTIYCNKCSKSENDVTFEEYEEYQDYRGDWISLCDECAEKGWVLLSRFDGLDRFFVKIIHESSEDAITEMTASSTEKVYLE